MTPNPTSMLFVGDSITRGRLGCSYVSRISDALPQVSIRNLGADGLCFNQVSERLLQAAGANPRHNYIVLQSGYFDLMLPVFHKKGGLHRWYAARQTSRGALPQTTLAGWATAWMHTIKRLQSITAATIVVSTIACIGERLPSEINVRREAFNDVLRSIAADMNLRLADCAAAFSQVLEQEVQGAYCIDSIWAAACTDRIRSAAGNCDGISRKRGLRLTIDGVHLNTEGATLFANCITELLRQPREANNTIATSTRIGS